MTSNILADRIEQLEKENQRLKRRGGQGAPNANNPFRERLLLWLLFGLVIIVGFLMSMAVYRLTSLEQRYADNAIAQAEQLGRIEANIIANKDRLEQLSSSVAAVPETVSDEIAPLMEEIGGFSELLDEAKGEYVQGVEALASASAEGRSQINAVVASQAEFIGWRSELVGTTSELTAAISNIEDTLGVMDARISQGCASDAQINSTMLSELQFAEGSPEQEYRDALDFPYGVLNLVSIGEGCNELYIIRNTANEFTDGAERQLYGLRDSLGANEQIIIRSQLLGSIFAVEDLSE